MSKTLSQLKAKLREEMAAVRANIDVVQNLTAGARRDLAAKVEAHAKLGDEINAYAADIQAIEQPRLHDLHMELARLADAESRIIVPTE